MNKWIMVAVASVMVATTLSLVAGQTDGRSPEAFCVVVLPDTQYYSLRHPDIFKEQTRWIKQNKEALNILFVLHEGDLTDQNSEGEWKVADEAMKVLDGTVPYCVVLGNHDIDPNYSDIAARDYVSFNTWFGPRRFDGQSGYGGHLGDGNENSFYFFKATGMDFMVLCLEFGPDDETLAWADKIVDTHPKHRTIVLTHCYTYFDDTRVAPGDQWNPKAYGLTDANDGEDMWNEFVRKHKNIFMVLSGHILGDGLGRLTSTGDHGNPVHQILANYQMQENGGNGFLRIMQFQPAEGKIKVRTYSPTLDQYATDSQNEFELEYPMAHPGGK